MVVFTCSADKEEELQRAKQENERLSQQIESQVGLPAANHPWQVHEVSTPHVLHKAALHFV